MLHRVRPSWLENSEAFYEPTYTFGIVRYLKPRSQQAQIVTRAIFRDEVVLGIYEEAGRSAVKGIAKGGVETLRRLLEDEHLELSREAHFEPAD
jgi:hypothetical protein